ncbi:DNA polymerase III subunit gamma/tau [Coprothermobacter platensis]|uniref:DNA polymerase III subunit gamma/tau n=1 Tax=Coprothermobacter platensis TaxID=108819 RepID=UPI00037FD941|nr:DNA polymerase III subunit gamma/tau [Coprothermobacter platensis]
MALYRKYRPQTFDEVIGQSHVTEILVKALDNQKVSHAYLFAGPKGSGKTSCARIFAKGLNCEQGITSKPDNTCESCKLINEGHSLDVIEIDAASNRGVDEIRELRERVKYRPAQSRYKVYIIDEAHMLTREAFNALLKTLEEPPDYVVFILATTDPQKIPPTVLSRCQRFRFKKLTSDEVYQILVNVCKKEGFSYEEEALQLIAEVSDGAVRDALNLLEQISVVDEGNVTAKTARFLLNVVDDDVVINLFSVASQDMNEAVSQMANLLESGIEPMELFRPLKTLVRRSVFKNNPWPREKALKMFKVLESFNYTMEHTEFPAVALVAILNELGPIIADQDEPSSTDVPAPKRQRRHQETNINMDPQEIQETPEKPAFVEEVVPKEDIVENAKSSFSDENETSTLGWLNDVKNDYLPLYVVLKEGKARVDADKLILSFPGLRHIYVKFMNLPKIRAVLKKYGDFSVDVEAKPEQKDVGVLDLFTKVFPGTQIEEVK